MLWAFPSAVPSSSNILYLLPPSLSLTKIFTESALPQSSAPVSLCEAFLTFPRKNLDLLYPQLFMGLFTYIPVYLHQSSPLLSPQLDCAVLKIGAWLMHLVVPGIWHRADHVVAPLFCG